MGKQDERKIKLPLPLEYCTVERAARLLGCEVEDIYHWHEIGAIRFYARLKKLVKGEISINMRNICNFESVKPSDYISEVTKRLVAERSGGLTLPNFVEDQDEMSHLEKVVLAIMHWDPDKDVNGTDGLSVISLGAFSDYAISTWALDELRGGYRCIKSNCMASGFWEIFPSTKNDDSDVMHLELEHGINTNWDHTIKRVQLEVDKAVWDGHYYLLSEDLLNLHKAIQTGNPLPNRYNNPDIAQKMREQEEQTDKLPTRVRGEQVVLTQELVKRVLNIENIDQPSKQAEILLTELSSTVPVEHLPSARSITRYLGGK